MYGDHPGQYRGFIWACAEFEANLAQKSLHALFGYADYQHSKAMLIALRHRYEEIIRQDPFDRPLKRRAQDELRLCEALFASYMERVFDAFEGSTYH